MISSGFPWNNTLPSKIMYALSTISSVLFTLWSVIRTPMFFFFRFCIKFFTSLIAIGSIPANGSSNNMKLGFEARHLAISNLLLSPPDKDSDGA